MPSSLDLFGPAPDAPQVDAGEHIVLAWRDPATETAEQRAARQDAQWRAERQNFLRNQEVRRPTRQPRRCVGYRSLEEAKRWKLIGLWPIPADMKELPIEEAERQHREAALLDDRIVSADDVYRWLLERAWIESAPNGKGWARLRTCPWQDDHDRNASEASQRAGWRTGRFGSFHCFGCRHTTREFFLWLHGVDPAFPGIVRYALAFGWEVRHA